MIGRFATRAARLAMLTPVFLGPALLGGCSTAATGPAMSSNAVATPAPPKNVPKPRVFTLDTPVNRIAADPQGKAVLDRDIPGLMSNKNYPMFDDMSLSEIALVSGGRLTKSRLALVKIDLIQISCLAPAN